LGEDQSEQVSNSKNTKNATRNPVVGEFMRALLRVLSDLSAKNSVRFGVTLS
jgi:hypothetical protein